MGNGSVKTAMKVAFGIKYGIMLLILFIVFPFMLFQISKHLSGLPAIAGLVFCLAFCIFSGFTLYTLAMQRWRLWAFSHVRNVHLLRSIASEHLFVPGKSLFFKGAYNTQSYKEQWEALQHRFDTPDEIIEDISLPDEIVITRNYVKLIIQSFIFLPIVVFIAGLMCLFAAWPYSLFMIIFSVLLFALFRRDFMKIFDNNIRLEIDINGILINNHEFHNWADISKVSIVGPWKYDISPYNINLIAAGKTIVISIDDYNTNGFELLNILQTFRLRYEQSELH